jgi:hypothetical protein
LKLRTAEEKCTHNGSLRAVSHLVVITRPIMGGGASQHAAAERERLVGISRKPASPQGHGSSSSEGRVEGTCPDSILGQMEEWLRDNEIDLGDLGMVTMEGN